MQLHPRGTLIVLLALPLALAITGQETSAQPSQVVEARARLVEAFRSVQALDFQGVSSLETGKLVERLNSALADLREANRTGSDSYATSSAGTSSQVLAEAQIAEATAERQTVLTQLTAYSIAIIAGALSSLITLDVDTLKRTLRQRKSVEVQVG